MIINKILKIKVIALLLFITIASNAHAFKNTVIVGYPYISIGYERGIKQQSSVSIYGNALALTAGIAIGDIGYKYYLEDRFNGLYGTIGISAVVTPPLFEGTTSGKYIGPYIGIGYQKKILNKLFIGTKVAYSKIFDLDSKETIDAPLINIYTGIEF